MTLDWKNVASYRDEVRVQYDEREQIKIADACRDIAAVQPHCTDLSVFKRVMNSFWHGRLRLFLLLCPRVEIQNRKKPTSRAYLFEERDGCIWRTRDIVSPDSRWEIAPKHEKDDGPFEFVEFDDTPEWQQVADREKVIHDPAFILHAIQQATQAVPRDMEPNEHTWRYINSLNPLPSFIVDWFSDSYCERVDLIRWCEEADFEIPKGWRRSPASSADESGAQPSDHPSDRQASAHNQALVSTQPADLKEEERDEQPAALVDGTCRRRARGRPKGTGQHQASDNRLVEEVHRRYAIDKIASSPTEAVRQILDKPKSPVEKAVINRIVSKYRRKYPEPD